MGLKEFLLAEYVKWRNAQPGDGKFSEREWAAVLGLKQQTLNKYMNNPPAEPDMKILDILASKLGPEVYEHSGKIPFDALLRRIIAAWPSVPDDKRESLANEAERSAEYPATTSNREILAEDE